MSARRALSAALTVLLVQALPVHDAPTKEALAHDSRIAAAGEGPNDRIPVEPGVIAALRAKGARVLALGERGGLDGHFVELADGDAYGLYLTPDGHAVAGLLYGPDGSLLTGDQIAAASGRGADIETKTVRPVSVAAPNEEAAASGGWQAGAARLAHAYVDDPAAPGIEAPDTEVDTEVLFERSASAFGFTLGRTGPLVVLFADPGCRWSRSAVARLGGPALDGRLRLHVVPAGVLGAASARDAASIASAPDPAMAWFEGTDAAGSAEGGRRIARNNGLFDAWGLGSVPLIAWRGFDGRIAHRLGEPDDIDAWLEALPHE